MIKKSIVLLLGTGGIVLAHMTLARWLSLVVSSILVFILFQNPSFELGIIYWLLSMMMHYTVLFGTFMKSGQQTRGLFFFSSTEVMRGDAVLHWLSNVEE